METYTTKLLIIDPQILIFKKDFIFRSQNHGQKTSLQMEILFSTHAHNFFVGFGGLYIFENWYVYD